MSDFVVNVHRVCVTKDGHQEESVVIEAVDTSMGWRLANTNRIERSASLVLPKPFEGVSIRVQTTADSAIFHGCVNISLESPVLEDATISIILKRENLTETFTMVRRDPFYDGGKYTPRDVIKDKWIDWRGHLAFQIVIVSQKKDQNVLILNNDGLTNIGRKGHEAALAKAFQTGLGADTTFVCRGKQIFAMRSLLIAQSEVFETMFSGTWRDTINGIIEVNGLDYEALYKLLESLHIGHSRMNGTKSALKLLELAHTYQVEHIIKQTEEYIARNVSQGNVLRVLYSGQLYSSAQLIKSVEEFFAGNKSINVRGLPDYDKVESVHKDIIINGLSK